MHKWISINTLLLPGRNFIGRNVSSAYGEYLGRSSPRPGRTVVAKTITYCRTPTTTLHPEYLKRVADLLWIVKQTKAILPNQHPLSPREPSSDFCSLSPPESPVFNPLLLPSPSLQPTPGEIVSRKPTVHYARQRPYILSTKCIRVLALSSTARSSPSTSPNKTCARTGKSNVAAIMLP